MSNCIAGMGGWVGTGQGERREEEPLIYGPPRPHPGARFGQLSMEAGKSPVRSRIRSQVRALSRVTRSYVKRGNVAHARVAQLEERVLPILLFAAQRHAVCCCIVASHHSTRIGSHLTHEHFWQAPGALQLGRFGKSTLTFALTSHWNDEVFRNLNLRSERGVSESKLCFLFEQNSGTPLDPIDIVVVTCVSLKPHQRVTTCC